MSDAAGRPSVVARFAITAPDGRRSAEWRVWTGKNRKVTDELYLAPRHRAAEFKYSLHSGRRSPLGRYSQLAYLKPVRDRLRPGDKGAIDKWKPIEQEILPNWRVALCLQFQESELRALNDRPLTVSTIKVPSAAPGCAVNVLVLIGTAAASLDGLDTIAVLDQESGGKVAVVHLALPFDPAMTAALRARAASRIPLIIPGFDPAEPFDWVVVPGKNGSRLVIEYAVSPREGGALPPLSPFRGTVLPWNEVPVEFRDMELVCGLLVYGPGSTSRLYVDQRARCDHSSLGLNAHHLCQIADSGRFDAGWGRLTTGESYTLLSTRRVLEEAGIDPDRPRFNLR